MKSISKRRSSSVHSGFTLVEMMIASLILVVMLGVLMIIYLRSLQYYALHDDANSVTQCAQQGLTRLAADLSEADMGSVHWDTMPAGIVFATPRGDDDRYLYDSTGALCWRRYICYYLDTVQGTSALVRKAVDIPFDENGRLPTSPPAIPTSRYTAWFRASSASAGWVCRNVTHISVSPSAYDGVVSIQLQATSTATGQDRVTQVVVSTSVLPRN